ncbi:MAG: hypothetical protein AMXMBFR84_15000 [Candidatus Hydrogenedentota bacterium]
MARVLFADSTCEIADGETVLETLERHGHSVPSSCRSGVCKSCLMRAIEGVPPVESQSGLKDTLKAQHFFLACRCKPESDLRVVMPGDGFRYEGVIQSKRQLSEKVIELRVSAPDMKEYWGGQYVTIINGHGVSRSYSIASVPELDGDLLFHMALIPGGAMSGWVSDGAQPGDKVTLQGPNGNCFYVPGKPEQPILLLGTGTGLAPLFAIARDAILGGHTGPIHLFHGSLRREGLYLVDELRELSELHECFYYHPCVLDGPAEDDVHVGAIEQHALSTVGTLKGWRVFLCGAPELVTSMHRKAFLAGASLQEIFSDPFVPAPAKART